ncbi:hypothetical protein KPL70_014478 [Citrus sinensis]|nr:hypothetical protein KPL70_014478 [Citrus sinensis]
MAEGKVREPLLKKKYYENCSGCKVDKLKESERGLPIRKLFIIWIIRDFHIAKREEDVGFYAGYVGSSYMLGRALTSVLWGMGADRCGRKPVIIIGCITVLVTSIFK